METMSSVTGNTSGAIGNGVTPSTNAVAAVTAPTTPAPTGKARIAVSFLLVDKDAQLLVDSARILTMMTGNAAYPTPDPALADITTARNSYAAAVTAAKDSRIGLKLRVQQRASLVVLLLADRAVADVWRRIVRTHVAERRCDECVARRHVIHVLQVRRRDAGLLEERHCRVDCLLVDNRVFRSAEHVDPRLLQVR